MIPLIRIAHAARRWLIGALRIRTIGVKVMLFDPAGDILLIRNSYGNRRLFVLPGGGVQRGESPLDAAAREVREELDVAARTLEPAGTFTSHAEGKRDTIHLFRGVIDRDLKPSPMEIEEAAFFPVDGLPASTSPATLRRIEEWRGTRPIDGCW